MELQRWEQIQGIFAMVADQKNEAVDRLCQGDPALAGSVLDLLQEDARQQSLLDSDGEQLIGRMAEASLATDHLRLLVQGQIGPYRLLRVLGEGGMGVVYLGKRTDIGGLVAIKLLRDAWLSPMRRERFLMEQQTLVKLNHPSIARIYDASTMEDGTPWFVMEYVEGLPLTEALRARGGSLAEDFQAFQRVCEAVQYAHSLAVIHRDLKPSNILCTAAGEVKLLDFGIAKQINADAEDSTRTIAGLRFLTPGYAAPEQSSGGSIGIFTDVYSLGVLLYEILTGQVPPRGTDEKLIKPSTIARNPQTTLSRFALSKPQWSELDALCLTALELQPERRYRSVDALSRDVASFLEGRPLEARPSSLLYKTAKFARRNRPALSSMAAAMVLLAAASLLFTVRLARARDVAVTQARRTERIQQFMQNMLGDEDLEGGPSNDLKVVTLLDRAEQRAGSLGEDAATQAQLYQTIGAMYARLGKYERAEQALTKALGSEKQLGSQDKEVAAILTQLAVVRGDHGELKQALQDVEEALGRASAAHLAANDPIAVKARVAMGRINLQSGAYQKAIDILGPIADGKPGNEGATLYDQRDSLSARAEAEMYTHRYDLSESDTRRAIALDRELFGDSHPRTAEDLMNLAALKASLAANDEAEPLYRQGISLLKAWYGPEHPDVILASSILARVLISEKKAEEAESLLGTVLESEEKVYGPVHERVAFTLDTLAELALLRGRFDMAEADLIRSFAIDRSLFGMNNVRTASTESNLGHVYLKEAKYAQAEATLRQATAGLETLPNGSNYIGLTRGRWGEALLALKRYEEAEEQLLAADKLMKALSHAPKELADVRFSLSVLYLKTRQPTKTGQRGSGANRAPVAKVVSRGLRDTYESSVVTSGSDGGIPRRFVPPTSSL